MIKADVKRYDHKPGLLVCCLLLAVKLNSETRVNPDTHIYTFTCNA